MACSDSGSYLLAPPEPYIIPSQSSDSSISFEILHIVDLDAVLGDLGGVVFSLLTRHLLVQDRICNLIRDVILDKASDVPGTILTRVSVLHNVVYERLSNLNRNLDRKSVV